jgi:XTP/dITP diphosphohydrolase
MNILLIATRNRHKTGEFSAMLGANFRVEDLTSQPGFPEVEETGATFLENAALKAVSASRYTQTPETFVLADDSGLETDALAGAPGVLSARFSGLGATDLQNLTLLLSKLSTATDRSARFRCAMAVASGGKLLASFEGSCEGRIIEQPRGGHGFGYDPVFVPEGHTQTFAELSPAIKNQISHRAKAFQQALAWLRGV